jgi:hypothetical protein
MFSDLSTLRKDGEEIQNCNLCKLNSEYADTGFEIGDGSE